MKKPPSRARSRSLPGSRHKLPTLEELAQAVHHLRCEWEILMATDKDLQAAVDALKAAVTALQNKPAPVALITQEQLDTDTADVAAAAAAVNTAATT